MAPAFLFLNILKVANMNTTKQSYSDKLKDPRWQKRRLLVFQRDDFTCLSCGNNRDTLHVHHIRYIPGLDPWEYEMHMLITYCEICHNTEHLIGNDIRMISIDLLNLNKIYIHQLAQINTLIEQYPAFYTLFKTFLDDCMMQYLRSKAA